VTTKFSDTQVATGLESIPDWAEINGQLTRTFQFETFARSIEFVNQLADYAEREQHHPDILVRYNRVTLTVSTHDANGITEKDFALATAADELAI
jgi:4a-hydroxytetrahydrobiopterin dehydratase